MDSQSSVATAVAMDSGDDDIDGEEIVYLPANLLQFSVSPAREADPLNTSGAGASQWNGSILPSSNAHISGTTTNSMMCTVPDPSDVDVQWATLSEALLPELEEGLGEFDPSFFGDDPLQSLGESPLPFGLAQPAPQFAPVTIGDDDAIKGCSIAVQYDPQASKFIACPAIAADITVSVDGYTRESALKHRTNKYYSPKLTLNFEGVTDFGKCLADPSILRVRLSLVNSACAVSNHWLKPTSETERAMPHHQLINDPTASTPGRAGVVFVSKSRSHSFGGVKTEMAQESTGIPAKTLREAFYFELSVAVCETDAVTAADSERYSPIIRIGPFKLTTDSNQRKAADSNTQKATNSNKRKAASPVRESSTRRPPPQPSLCPEKMQALDLIEKLEDIQNNLALIAKVREIMADTRMTLADAPQQDCETSLPGASMSSVREVEDDDVVDGHCDIDSGSSVESDDGRDKCRKVPQSAVGDVESTVDFGGGDGTAHSLMEASQSQSDEDTLEQILPMTSKLLELLRDIKEVDGQRDDTTSEERARILQSLLELLREKRGCVSNRRTRIVFLAVDADSTNSIGADKEYEAIRESFPDCIVDRYNTTPVDLVSALVQSREAQRDRNVDIILHLCVHGNSNGIFLARGIQSRAQSVSKGKTGTSPTSSAASISSASSVQSVSISSQRIASAIGDVGRHLRFVVINSCCSRAISREIARTGGVSVISPHRDLVGNAEAIELTRQLYAAIAAGNKPSDAVAIVNTMMKINAAPNDPTAPISYRFIQAGEAAEVVLRAYQAELVRKCFSDDGNYVNTIITAPTNSGKTTVAAKVCLKVPRPGARVFICNTTTLADQIAARLPDILEGLCVQDNTSPPSQVELVVGSGAGSDDGPSAVEKLSLHIAAGAYVAVTADILKQAIERGVVSMRDIGVLVFDECNLCHKEYSYNVIMKDGYRPAFVASDGTATDAPHILGLSATPFVKDKGTYSENLERLCANLCCGNVASVVEHQQGLVDAIGKGSTVSVWTASLRVRDTELHRIIQGFLADTEKWVTDCTSQGTDRPGIPPPGESASLSLDNACVPRLRGRAAKVKDTSIRAAKVTGLRLMPAAHALLCIADVLDVLDTIGAGAAIQEFDAYWRKENGSTEKETERFVEAVARRYADRVHQLPDADREHVSPLVERVASLLHTKLIPGAGKAIVMCESRACCTALHRILLSRFTELKPVLLLGSGGSDGLSEAQQRRAYVEFRSEDSRILVATKIANYGLDFPGCTLGVAVSLGTNGVEHVQAKGRVRSERGEFCIVDYAGAAAEKAEEAERSHSAQTKAISDVAEGGDAARRIAAAAGLARQRKMHEERQNERRKKEEQAARNAEQRSRLRREDYDVVCSRCHRVLCSASALHLVGKMHLSVGRNDHTLSGSVSYRGLVGKLKEYDGIAPTGRMAVHRTADCNEHIGWELTSSKWQDGPWLNLNKDKYFVRLRPLSPHDHGESLRPETITSKEIKAKFDIPYFPAESS